MKANSLHLLQALNAAAAMLQRTSHSEAEVLNACRDEIARLGFRGGLSLLDDTGECLVVKATVQPQWLAKILTDLEKRTGYKSKDYSFPVQRVSVYRQAIGTRQAVFMPESSQTVTEMLPDSVRPIAGVIIQALGSPPGIYAPLNSQDRTIGVLNIVGNGLTPDDVPAAEAFANHIAIALDNAKLFGALYDSEQRFRILADAAFEGIAVIEREIVVDFNDQLAQMLGYCRDELINKPVMHIVAPESRDRVAEAMRGGRFEPYEHLALRKDGTIFPVEVRTRTARIRERQARITAIRDISERRQAEEALRASEDKFSTAFHVSPDSVNINRLSDGLYIEINEGFTVLTGYTAEDVRGKTSADLKIWANTDDRARLVKKLREQGIVNNLEAPVRHKDGRMKTGLMSARIIQVNDEPCILSITRDITERKQAELEREKLIAKLETQNAELERFTYTASHDLKSPLVTIMGFLGYLEKDATSGDIDTLKADILRITTAANKMQHLLNDLLELSRIGRMMNSPEEVLFEDIVFEALALTKGQTEAHRVQVNVATDLPMVCGDRVRLVEVMQNLIENACKFMGDQAEPYMAIGCRGTDRDGKPILFVRDNGIGIEPRYHEKVFGLFDKLDPKSEGTGIGLALVKRIVEVHGGRIWVEAEVGNGATFCFTLPGSR